MERFLDFRSEELSASRRMTVEHSPRCSTWNVFLSECRSADESVMDADAEFGRDVPRGTLERPFEIFTGLPEAFFVTMAYRISRSVPRGTLGALLRSIWRHCRRADQQQSAERLRNGYRVVPGPSGHHSNLGEVSFSNPQDCILSGHLRGPSPMQKYGEIA